MVHGENAQIEVDFRCLKKYFFLLQGREKQPMMGMRGGGRDCFVVVSYDFEYSTEDGKRVWMKEGEVLLLLAKTNNDWWQVSHQQCSISVVLISVVYPEPLIPGLNLDPILQSFSSNNCRTKSYVFMSSAILK
jgi:hypothetical protein